VAGAEAPGADGVWIGGSAGLVAQAATMPASISDERRMIIGKVRRLVLLFVGWNCFNLMGYRLEKETAGIRPKRKRLPALD
jgi:hypothetical protein